MRVAPAEAAPGRPNERGHVTTQLAMTKHAVRCVFILQPLTCNGFGREVPAAGRPCCAVVLLPERFGQLSCAIASGRWWANCITTDNLLKLARKEIQTLEIVSIIVVMVKQPTYWKGQLSVVCAVLPAAEGDHVDATR